MSHLVTTRTLLTEALRPETPREKLLVESITDDEVVAALAVMIQRRVRLAWIDGAEVGRREIEEEQGIRR